MSHTPAPYPSNSGLAKGAAVAAIVYSGMLLLLSESIVLFAGSLLSIVLRQSNTELASGLGTMGISFLALLGVFCLLAFGIPLALAIWMLVAAHRNRSGQVLTVLVIYSVLSAISLAAELSQLVSDSGGTTGTNLTLLVWLAIVALGWVGWSRMRQEPASGMIDYQSSAIMPTQLGAYSFSAQQYGWSSDGQYAQGAAGQYPGYGYGQDPLYGQYGSYGQYGQQPGAQSPYQGYADPGDPAQRGW